jgi:hypothetical protein
MRQNESEFLAIHPSIHPSFPIFGRFGGGLVNRPDSPMQKYFPLDQLSVDRDLQPARDKCFKEIIVFFT